MDDGWGLDWGWYPGATSLTVPLPSRAIRHSGGQVLQRSAALPEAIGTSQLQSACCHIVLVEGNTHDMHSPMLFFFSLFSFVI